MGNSSYIKTPNNKGATIVECILAIVIMLIVVVGSGAFIYHSAIRINIERNKRLALEAANGRLEEMRASLYDKISPTPANDGDLHYIQGAVGNWQHFDIKPDPPETVDINGTPMPITTATRYIDLDGSSPPNDYDYLEVTVSVVYRLSSSENVTLTTNIGPR